MSDEIFKTARNNPPHLFVGNTLYMLTASIYEKVQLLETPKRKIELRDAFSESAKLYQWQIIAWAILNNHYHAILQSPEDAKTLSKFIGSYHKFTARQWNVEDRFSKRKVWWNYWDTCIRSERDYYNRLKYVFWNAVKHGLVENPEDYPFSNYKEYMQQSQGFDFAGMDEVNDVPEF